MANKTITQVGEKVTPDLTDVLLIEDTNASPVTFKTKIGNLLKRLFTFDDVYDDYQVNINTIGGGSGNSAPTVELFRDGIYLHEFPNAPQVTEGYFMIHLMHDMKPNSDMYFHLHWSHNHVAPTGNLKWNIDFTYAKGYEQEGFGAPVTLSTIHAVNAQYSHHITDDDDMIVSASTYNLEPDGILLGRVWRDSTDAEDTTNVDAFLMQVDLHYVKSRTGTTERNPPFTSGGF